MSSKTPDFVHLHTHSHYSLLTALPKIEELVAAAKEDGQKALALTDNGNLYGTIDFYKECKKQGIKPIIGVDLYVAPRTRHDKEHRIDNKTSRLVLLAKNETGYKNLIKLVSRAHLEGFYYTPRADRELVAQYKEGLIAILPSFAGEPSQHLKEGDRERAEESLAWHKETFGKSLYAEITHHPEIEGHEARMKKWGAFAKGRGVPLVAAHDTYYLKPDDAFARELVVKIKTGGTIDRDMGVGAEDFSFISRERARELFMGEETLLENAVAIADQCNLELALGHWFFPNFTVPSQSSHDKELRALAYAGLARRGLQETPEIKERIEYELKVIGDKGYSPYFLVVADLLAHAATEGIFTNTRGSAAGSLVSYLTGITTVNPLEFQLPFERFLNPDRPSPPDIDMDIADNRRDDLINYMRGKYGNDHVAQVGTFGTMMARAAVRDVARALGHSYNTGDQIAKLIPFGKQGFPVTVDGALREVADLRQVYEDDPEAREILDLARKIEGGARHVGVHAAGVVIAPSPVIDHVPVQLDPKGGKIITQYDMYAVEDAGLLKFDFLGLKNLSILADAVARVRNRFGDVVDVDRLPRNDPKTFAMLAAGNTLGVFQMASEGMTSYLVKLKPTRIEDLSLMVALYRPGPMENIDAYIARKHGKEKAAYLHPNMQSYLEKTFGVLVYQDDLLMTAVEIAGYTWGEVDRFRKAVGKKIPEEMAKQHVLFVDGCIKKSGMKRPDAEALWKLFEPFQGYGFNKCLPADARVIDANTGVPTMIGALVKSRRSPVVLALSGRENIVRARAHGPFKNGVKKIYRLRTRSGRTIRATGNHPFKVWGAWKKLEDLSRGTRIAVPRFIPPPKKPIPLTQHEAATLGYLIAEGNLCHPHGVYFYSTAENEISDFCRHVHKFANARCTIDRSKAAASVYVGQKNQRAGNALKQWLKTLGLNGKKATEKNVPERVFGADNFSVACFLGKMWQGDGAVSVKNGQIFYATSSQQLASDVQILLLRFAVLSTIHRKRFRYRGGIKSGYTVVVTGIENLDRFEKAPGKHLIGAKREALRILIRNTGIRTNNRGRGTADTLPLDIAALIHSETKRAGYNATTLARKARVAERLLYRDGRKRGYTRMYVEKVARALGSKALLHHAMSDVFWDEVLTIEESGREETYDLAVAGVHNFVADGFFVHNSHAASYGNLVYQTAYMKAHYPSDYMAAVLTADSGDVEEVGKIVAECRRMGIAVLAPDVNESMRVFTVVGDSTIRFGLGSIKNFGEGVANTIISERKKGGPFASLADFLARVTDKNLNKKSLESLIQSGALDQLGERGTMLVNIETLLAFHKEHTKAPTDQGMLFGAPMGNGHDLRLTKAPAAAITQKLAWEKELLGLYISGNPLDAHKAKLAKQKFDIAAMKEKLPPDTQTVISGIVEKAQVILTKGGERMVFLTVADYGDSIEVVCFPRIFKEYAALLVPGSCILVKGRLSPRNNEQGFVAEAVRAL